MRKSSDKSTDILAGIILYGAIFAVCVSKISSNPFILILSFGVGGLVITLILAFLNIFASNVFVSIRQKIRNAKAAKEPCPHGVVGGRTQLKRVLGSETQLKCLQCNQEKKEAERKEQLEKLHWEATAKIRVAADKLQTEEYTRLTKLRTHKIDFLLRLSPAEFEEVVGDMYRRFGYSVERTPMTNDFGRDLILRKDGKTGFVECKRYDKDMSIGRRPLQQFYGVIVNMHADFGIFVTTSYFAKTAVAFAGETDIQLVDGYALAEKMVVAFPGEGSADEYRAMCRDCEDIVVFNLRDPVPEIMCRNGHLVKNDSPDSLKIRLIAEAPLCEKCGSKMRLMNGRFWGCSNYPKCRNRKRFSGR